MAGAFTNTVFGFLRCYLFLAVAGGAIAGGYTPQQLASYVWAAQGLLAVVLLWSPPELADRIRTGEVVSDLLRPVDPVHSMLAADLGRAWHALLTRCFPPVLAGLLFFDLYIPVRWHTPPLFAISVVLAVVITFCCRFLVNSTAYWLLDVRGPVSLWALGSGVVAGLYFPLRFLPEPALVTLWLLTPLPSLFQAPLDVLVEVDSTPVQLGIVALQAVWAVIMLLLCHAVQRRAERRLVIQGG
ncbi:ABC-2 type transport system permease protein [Catenuloplanes nepalensis]|uniref:ABC-2 type transport system permease protein n=1 Tax=Catenuloplanes nepalensis TaxID=587533 RepID=A0ABT9MK95_9ACTN|nr:ABC-2 family transporter protein [Catenuloplanes nepalensis]MDP9791833.1 ABC-2 type transport system permease protein [Catenuloplanes nepalensis]